MHYLKQSTASTIKLGPFLDDTDGKTAETGLTIAQADIRISKNGGAFAQTNNAAGATHDELGWYGVPLNTTDTATLGRLKVAVHESGALPCFAEFMVVTANVYDSLCSTDILQADVTQCGGSAVAAGAIPNAAADAAGGLPVSDAGNLDLDTKLANTNEITAARMGALTDWINGGRLDNLLDAIPTTAMRGTDGANTTVPDAAGVAPTAAEIKTAIEAAGSHLALILADTGTDGVLLAATATSAQLVDDTWDEILSGATHNIATSAGRRVREIGAYAIESGTAQAGNSHTITLAATASAVDGTYNRNLIVLTDNTGVGQTRTIVDYNGTTKVAIIDRDWRTSPDATSDYQVTPDNTPLVVDQGVAQAGTATTITLRAYASAVNDAYLCNVVAIIAGTGRGQARLVGGYVGATKVVTICGDNWVTTPDTTSVYVLMPYGTTCTSCIGTHALGLINTECDTANSDYGANTVVPDAAGVAPTAAEIKTAIEAADSHLALILADTGELQTDWVNGGRLDLILDIIAADTTTDIPALIAALYNISAANVNTEVSDVMKTDTISEPSQGAPPATPTFEEAVAYLYFKLRNKSETTAAEDALYDDAGTTKLIKATISDDATTFTKGEYGSGA